MAGNPERLVFRVHAIERMFQRGVTVEDVRQVLATGETIQNYPDDNTPYPSRLVLGRLGSRPLHVVFAENKAMREIIVVTVYEPDADHWYSDFRRRRA